MAAAGTFRCFAHGIEGSGWLQERCVVGGVVERGKKVRLKLEFFWHVPGDRAKRARLLRHGGSLGHVRGQSRGKAASGCFNEPAYGNYGIRN
jgi:hypothetical protein